MNWSLRVIGQSTQRFVNPAQLKELVERSLHSTVGSDGVVSGAAPQGTRLVSDHADIVNYREKPRVFTQWISWEFAPCYHSRRNIQRTRNHEGDTALDFGTRSSRIGACDDASRTIQDEFPRNTVRKSLQLEHGPCGRSLAHISSLKCSAWRQPSLELVSDRSPL